MDSLKAAKKIDQQREHYATIASRFDQTYNRENSNHFYKIEQIEKAFERLLPPSGAGWDLLEIGAGSGIHAEHVLAQLGDKIGTFVLADLSMEMLGRARVRMGNNPKVDYVVSPAEEISLDRKFDGIYVSGSMHHFSDYHRSIAAARSLLKSHGILAICEPNVWNPVNLVKALKDYSLEAGQFSVTRHNVADALLSEGFEVLTSRVLHFRAGNRLGRTLYPYESLEKVRWLDYLSVMFLLVARLKGNQAV